jgi:hypothetical protein
METVKAPLVQSWSVPAGVKMSMETSSVAERSTPLLSLRTFIPTSAVADALSLAT